MFPSPLGVMDLKVGLHVCLVYRFFVSVPVRGNGFESPSDPSAAQKTSTGKFPSPLGVMDLKEGQIQLMEVYTDIKVSVPVRGNGFESYQSR